MLYKLLSYFLHPSKIILFLGARNIIPISDEKYLKLQYKIVLGENLDLDTPKTFNEKLQWLKLHDRKSIYTTMVDKNAVKDYISNIIGEEYIIPNLGIYDKFDDIDFSTLPDKFVIKCTHDSGGVVICKSKNELNIPKVRKNIEKSLKKNFYYLAREWPYKNVTRKIIIEKYMGNNLNDYKIFCFNGEPKVILVCSNREGKNKNTDFYDVEWNKLPFTRAKHTNNPNGILKPKKLEEMLVIAKKLSKDIPFVRVDLYDINDKIYFGELTFFPSGGFEGFNPKEWDEKLGEWIVISNK